MTSWKSMGSNVQNPCWLIRGLDYPTGECHNQELRRPVKLPYLSGRPMIEGVSSCKQALHSIAIHCS